MIIKIVELCALNAVASIFSVVHRRQHPALYHRPLTTPQVNQKHFNCPKKHIKNDVVDKIRDLRFHRNRVHCAGNIDVQPTPEHSLEAHFTSESMYSPMYRMDEMEMETEPTPMRSVIPSPCNTMAPSRSFSPPPTTTTVSTLTTVPS